MILKYHRLARTREIFGRDSQPSKQKLPTIKRGTRRDKLVMTNITNMMGKQRLPNLAAKPFCQSTTERDDSPSTQGGSTVQNVNGPDDINRYTWQSADSWKLGEMIGSGTSGEIFKAFHLELGRTFAVKRMVRPASDCLENEEIRIFRRLKHRNIVYFFGTYLTEDHQLILMEYLPEKSLRHLMNEYGKLEYPTIKIYLQQILSAVDYMHQNGFLHRDLKASNILVSSDGNVKLTDFGSACYINKNPAGGFDQPEMVGSVLWSAPETLKESKYSVQSDIWSIGCLVIYLATGGLPWNEQAFDNEYCAIYRIGTYSIRPQIPTHLSRDLRSIVTSCLALDPVRRPSCRSLLQLPYFN